VSEVGDGYVSIIPTMKGAGSKIQSDLNAQVGPAADKVGASAGKRFGSKFSAGAKGIAAGAFAGIVTAKTISFLKDSVAEGREAQKVGATTNAILKSTGGVANVTAAGIGKLSNALSVKTGVDDEAIQTGANLLLTFKNVRNEAGKGNKVFDQATAAAVDLSAAGFGSIDSASKMLGKALNDPVKGVTALSRAGVTFTQQQKDQIKTLVKSGDVLGAQKLILGEVQSQVGGVAAASATSGEKLTTTFNNFKESIGTALLPTIDAINGKLIGFFGFVQSHQSVMVALGVLVGGVLVGAFLALAVSVIAATWPFLLAGIAIAAVAGLFVYAYKHSEIFRAGVNALGAAALDLVSIFLTMTAKVAGAWASMLGAVAKVPGFGWAKGASKALQTVADKAQAAADKTGTMADNLRKVPKSTKADVKTPKLGGPVADLKNLGKGIKDLPASKKSEIKVNSLKTPITETRNLKTNIDGLRSKTISIRTNYTSTGTPPRKASGSIVSGATRLIAGETGREAIVPLDRPLNMVDPSVRWLAAYAQGKTDLGSMRPMSLGPLDGGDSTGGSSGPVQVEVINVGEFDGRSRRVARGEIDSERAFAGTTGRMG
jgi:hypothetical protein